METETQSFLVFSFHHDHNHEQTNETKMTAHVKVTKMPIVPSQASPHTVLYVRTDRAACQ